MDRAIWIPVKLSYFSPRGRYKHFKVIRVYGDTSTHVLYANPQIDLMSIIHQTVTQGCFMCMKPFLCLIEATLGTAFFTTD